MANTPHRTLRFPEDVWKTAVAKARNEGTTVTAVLLAALKRYNARAPKP